MTSILQHISPALLEIDPYIAGKSKVGDNKNVIKLSSNENPTGTSEKARAAYSQCVAQISLYPDSTTFELRNAIASHHNLNPDLIVCGNGSDELLTLIPRIFAQTKVGGARSEVIYSRHGFLIYPIVARAAGALPIVAEETNLTSDIDNILQKITKQTRVIFIANPNNPTGSYVPYSEILRLIQAVSSDIVIVLDLAYAEYVTASDYGSYLELPTLYENLVITRTFSKIYGLAALRIGWCYASAPVAAIMNRVRDPFSVSSPAQAAAIAAIQDQEFVRLSLKINSEERKFLMKELGKLDNMAPRPSVANFILLDLGSEELANDANNHLLNDGIIIRQLKAYGLPHCLRITIGMNWQNKRLIDSLSQFSQDYTQSSMHEKSQI